jgi:hypothetical protein
MSDPHIIDVVALALSIDDTSGLSRAPEYYRDFSRRLIAAVTPLIRADALEEAAKVADDEDGQFSYAGEHRNMAMLQQCCREIAAAIRALAGRPADPT